MFFEWLGKPATGHLFFLITPIAALLLVALLNKRRVSFALPALLVTLILGSPWFGQLFEKITKSGYYWRVLWIIPVLPVCAAFPSMLAEKVRNEHFKAFIAILCAVGIYYSGCFLYDQPLGRFLPASNAAKVDQEIVDIADVLLAQEDHPRAVVDRWPAIFLRQYTGDVELLYGRDIMGFIEAPRASALEMDEQLASEEGGDMQIVAQIMRDENYRYLVTDDRKGNKKQDLLDNGFEHITTVDFWGIYRLRDI